MDYKPTGRVFVEYIQEKPASGCGCIGAMIIGFALLYSLPSLLRLLLSLLLPILIIAFIIWIIKRIFF
ncbi:hypothetical protein RN88_03070 [Streptococcus intermedius]|nr:hypothetical protein RN88_03070 [Streptococcus intermedius]ARC25760.1 hypothetical protein A6J72_00075 [Streptococcus intermedius]